MPRTFTRLTDRARRLGGAEGAILYLVKPPHAGLGIAGVGSLAGQDGPREFREESPVLRTFADGTETTQAGEHALLHLPLRSKPSAPVLGVLTLVSATSKRQPGELETVAEEIAERLERQTPEERDELTARALLIASERRFRAFMAAMPAVGWIKDEAGRYTFVNPEFERLWRIGVGEIQGKTDLDFLPPVVAEAVRASDAIVARTKELHRAEQRVPTADREDRIWLSTKFPLESVEGETHIGGVAFDVTEMKRAQAVIRDQTAALVAGASQLRALFDAVGDGVLIHQHDRFVFANDAARRMFGLESTDEIVDRGFEHFFEPAEVEAIRADALRVEKGEPILAVRRARRKDGTTFLLEAHGTPIMYEGAPARAAVIRDVTEREARRERSEMAGRLAMIGTMTAAISHEVNNPLTVVFANLELLGEQLREHVAERPELGSLVTDAIDAADRIRALVASMSSLRQRLDAPIHAPYDLGETVKVAVDRLAPELEGRARCAVELLPTPRVDADPTRLLQVVLALVTNAVDALPADDPERTVTIRTLTDAAGHAVVEVHDDGCGVPRGNLRRIFDPFFTTKDPSVHQGLGLALAHSAVASMGGEITVTSEIGAGTIFRVALPPAIPSPTAPRPSLSAPHPARPRILVVDDEPAIGRVVANGFQRHADTVVVTSAAEALRALERGGFDAIVSDVTMPMMDGVALHAEVTRRFPALARRTVFISGGALNPRAEAFLSITENPRLAKPFRVGALWELVAQLLTPPDSAG